MAYQKSKQPSYNYITAKKTTVVREVSVTGKVRASENVSLAFEQSGRVAKVYAKIGDKVWAGQELARLTNDDMAAKLLQAQADLNAEKAKFDEMNKGARPEEVKMAETDLENAKSRAAVDLREDYDAAAKTISAAVVKGKNALLTFTDLQFKYFTAADQDGVAVSEAKKTAVKTMLGADNAGMLAVDELSKLEGGAYGIAQNAVLAPTTGNIDAALTQTLDALQKVQSALSAVKVLNSFTAAEKANLATEKTTIAGEIAAVSAKEQAIKVQNVASANGIAAAQSALDLKKAGYAVEQILGQSAKVKSAEANVKNCQALLAKTILISPINGIVARQDAKVGEVASANATLISLININSFEIEANVPEADVAKIKIGNTADVTLDAYGNDVVFGAKIFRIDPVETVVEGVPTYKTAFRFAKEDSRIKSGMTANIDVLTDRKGDVIAVSSRAVIIKNGGKVVNILKNNGVEEVKVTTGLRGSDGNVEIVSGVDEGDKVIVNPVK